VAGSSGLPTLREALESGKPLELNRVTWQPIETLAPSELGSIAIEPDDLLIVVGEDESIIPVHAVWHPVRLEAGIYRIDGELPTMPGFDPGPRTDPPRRGSSCSCATCVSS
jgi:hypothetical protein